MGKFENYFEISEELYCEALHKMIPVQRFVMYGIATILLAVSAVVMFIGKNYSTAILWFVLAALLGFYGFLGIEFKAKKFYRNNFAAICDNDGRLWRRTSFFDDNFKVTEPKSKAIFKYSAIRSVNESKNLYVLVLSDKQLVFIKKGAFENASDSDFVDFLKKKCNAQ